MIDIGKSLKFHREAKKYSQSALAKLCGISQQSLSRWENNENIPNALDCAKLARFYGITIDYLIGLENIDGSKNEI
ncbi:MAG: helix-turn-helix transcriptional regulator [Clostridia bacterium]|nr:helix-turn-helix transcriptional regulator [Clostridia bacterium]